MSRSKKKTPIRGISSACSEKQDKRNYNRRFRRLCKQLLDLNLDADPLPHLRECSNPWDMDKDGKRWFDAALNSKRMRK
ncbi:hypothetical protein BH18ACI4_BH18ACI4_01560 [soil metagenome]